MQNIKAGDKINSDKKPGTPDFYVHSLCDELEDRQDFLEDAHAYLNNAPVSSDFQLDNNQEFSGIERLQNMSRNANAILVTSAATDRLGIVGFRSAENSSGFGDEEIQKAFDKDDMGVGAQEAQWLACAYRNAYLLVDPVTKRQKVVPPTNGAVISDSSGEPTVALHLFYDRLRGLDVLELYVRDVDSETGEATGGAFLFTATRETPSWSRSETGISLTDKDTEVPLQDGMGSNWVWWKRRKLDTDRIPMTPLRNKDGKNEFEDHTDIIDRINHMIFQRVVIVTMQAFRQRAVKGNFPKNDPETGEEINYNEVFSPGPGTLWTIPADGEIWESTPPQYQEILEATKADTRDLASLTYTPMSYFSDSANQAAEGAESQRESYISRIEDRRRRFNSRWKRHISILMEILGDPERSEEDRIDVIWQPIRVESMNKSMASYSTAVGAGMSATTAQREVLQWTPKQIRQARNEADDDYMLALARPKETETPLGKRAHSIAGNDNGGGRNNEKKE